MTSTVTSGSTIAIRLPTTRPPDTEGAPAFTVDAPMAGKVVGLRTDLAWRSWKLIASKWAENIHAAGATTLEIETGAQVGKEGHDDRATVNEWSEKVDFGIVGLGTCGSCTSFSVYDAVAPGGPREAFACRGVLGVRDATTRTWRHRPLEPQGAGAATSARGPS